MNLRLLSPMEQYLEAQLSEILMLPSDIAIFWQSESPETELRKYLDNLTARFIDLCMNLSDFFYQKDLKNIYPQPQAMLFNSGNDDFFAALCNDSPFDKIDDSRVKDIFLRLFDIRKHKELLELSERDALARLPDDIRFYWEKASEQYSENFAYDSDTAVLSLVYDWGALRLRLLEAELPQSLPESVFMRIHTKALVQTETGYCLLLRLGEADMYDNYVLDQPAYEIVITFFSFEYSFEPYDYYSLCQVNHFPSPNFNIALSYTLSHHLTIKHNMMGADLLNDNERTLISLAEMLLCFQRTANIGWLENAVKDIQSPEELYKFATLLKDEAKDKYLSLAISAVKKYVANPEKRNLKRIRGHIKRGELALSTFEGLLPFRWILTQFKIASGAYPIHPAATKYHENVATGWREKITGHLFEAGFSGEYPSFRRLNSDWNGEFISFSEIQYRQPNGLSVCLTAAATKLLDNQLQGVPFNDITAYDCQHHGKQKERHIILGLDSEVYHVNELSPDDEQLKTPEDAWAEIDGHLEQVYRFFAGKRLTKEYKKKYGIKNDFGKRVSKFSVICLIMGLSWSLFFWPLFSAFTSVMAKEPYLKTLLDPVMMWVSLGGGLAFAILIWIVFVIAMWRLPGRK